MDYNMKVLIFISLLGMFAYHCSAIVNEFKGKSTFVFSIFNILGAIGYLVFFATLIWSFWPFLWWQPIVALIVSMLGGAMTAIIFQTNIIGMLLSVTGVVVFSILSIWGLLNI